MAMDVAAEIQGVAGAHVVLVVDDDSDSRDGLRLARVPVVATAFCNDPRPRARGVEVLRKSFSPHDPEGRCEPCRGGVALRGTLVQRASPVTLIDERPAWDCAPAPPHRGRVLVVDDDDALREMIAEVLAGAGYAVREARDGAEAFKLLCEPPRPHLILLDLMMPGVDGLAFREIQRQYLRWEAIPVVVLSAYALRLGPLDVAAVLDKPCDITTLLAAVNQHLRRSTAALPG